MPSSETVSHRLGADEGYIAAKIDLSRYWMWNPFIQLFSGPD